MNWLIDGVYGDLYRTAMGHPARTAARDEWAIERDLHRPIPAPGATRQWLSLAAAAARRHWIARHTGIASAHR